MLLQFSSKLYSGIFHCLVIACSAQFYPLTSAQPRDPIEEPILPRSHHNSLSHSRAEKHSGVMHYFYVPLEVLSRKGGLDLNQKTHLIQSGRVFIAHKLRHLFFTGSGLPIDSSGREFRDLAVCRGQEIVGPNLVSNASQTFDHFACPVSVRGSRLNFIDASVEAAFCCGLNQSQQACCDRDAFYRLYGTPIQASTAVLVVAVIASGVAVILLLGGLLFWLKLRRRDAARTVSFSHRHFDSREGGIRITKPDPARVPLIKQESPLFTLRPTSPQTPVLPSELMSAA